MIYVSVQMSDTIKIQDCHQNNKCVALLIPCFAILENVQIHAKLFFCYVMWYKTEKMCQKTIVLEINQQKEAG